MASDSWQLKIELSDEFKGALQKSEVDLKAAQNALSEERIRQIVREELAAWEKRQQQARRFGLPMNSEAK